jgi:predicted PolB exonuclease-like 3'-5' exonuclease
VPFDVIQRYKEKTFDILKYLLYKTDRRISLQDLAEKNLGQAKSGSGHDAPLLFQEKRIEELKAYLAQDLKLTGDIYEYMCNNHCITYTLYVNNKPFEKKITVNVHERVC